MQPIGMRCSPLAGLRSRFALRSRSDPQPSDLLPLADRRCGSVGIIQLVRVSGADVHI
jgi:hypothetical protein